MTITTKSAKAKGRRLQHYVRDTLRNLFPDLSDDDVISQTMGMAGEDILLSPAAKVRLGISVECKSKAKIAVYAFYEQCARNSQGREPVVVLKEDGERPLAMVDADHYFGLLQAVLGERP